MRLSLSCPTVLKRIYGDELTKNNYSTTVSSLAFAGTVVGMLTFGYLSDKLGRKFGMVSLMPRLLRTRVTNVICRCLPPSLSPFSQPCQRPPPARTTASAVCSPCSVPAGMSSRKLRSPGTFVDVQLRSFLLGIGVGAEYPCGSVAASEQSEEPSINKNAQHRWFALATSAF